MDNREHVERDRQDEEGERDENRNQRQAQKEAPPGIRKASLNRALAFSVHVSDHILGPCRRGVKGAGHPRVGVTRDRTA